MTLYQALCYFVIYAFLGWVVEVAFHALRLGKIIHRCPQHTPLPKPAPQPDRFLRLFWFSSMPARAKLSSPAHTFHPGQAAAIHIGITH